MMDIEKFKTEKGTYLLDGNEFEKKFITSQGIAPEGYEYIRIKREEYFELCAICEQKFTPTDCQNDACDKCLYKK